MLGSQLAELKPPGKPSTKYCASALLSPDQHRHISAWIAQVASPEEILKMPAPLWQAGERASAVMGMGDDLMGPPSLDAGGVVDA